MGNRLFHALRGIEMALWRTILLPFRAWKGVRYASRRARALAGGYFWLPCPCSSPLTNMPHYFGGQEWNPNGVMLALGPEILAVCDRCQKEARHLNFIRERSDIVASPELIDEIRKNGRAMHDGR